MSVPSEILTRGARRSFESSPNLLNELVHLDARERFAVLLRALIEQHVPDSVPPQDAAYFLATAAQDMLASTRQPDATAHA